GYWPFEDDDKETTWAAELSKRNHGKLEGQVSRKPGVFGKALTFSGRGSYFDYGNPAQYNFTAEDSLTYAVWVKTTADSGAIISQRDSKDGAPIVALVLQNQGAVRAVVRGNGVVWEDAV